MSAWGCGGEGSVCVCGGGGAKEKGLDLPQSPSSWLKLEPVYPKRRDMSVTSEVSHWLIAPFVPVPLTAASASKLGQYPVAPFSERQPPTKVFIESKFSAPIAARKGQSRC
jgi:hypothetical protein